MQKLKIDYHHIGKKIYFINETYSFCGKNFKIREGVIISFDYSLDDFNEFDENITPQNYNVIFDEIKDLDDELPSLQKDIRNLGTNGWAGGSDYNLCEVVKCTTWLLHDEIFATIDEAVHELIKINNKKV